MLKTNHYHIPVDRVAKRVTQEASIEDRYSIKDRDRKVGVEFWETPKTHKQKPNCTNFTDLTGKVIGRLTVVGWLGGKTWQCRCTCGRYCGRKSKFIMEIIKGRESTDVMCTECYALMLIKKREYFKNHGKYPSDNKKLLL